MKKAKAKDEANAAANAAANPDSNSGWNPDSKNDSDAEREVDTTSVSAAAQVAAIAQDTTTARGALAEAEVRAPLELIPPPCVVTIACGIESTDELRRFFLGTPADTGIAFVVLGIFNSSESREQRENLSTSTPMLVRVVAEPTPLEQNTVYQVPPDTFIELRDSVLYPVPPPNSDVAPCPADHFLRTVSSEKRERSIAVILSGVGTDGALGIRAVEAEGGISLVINPEFAARDGMPRSAIRTGIVDYILEPERMPEIVVRYTRHSYVESVSAESDPVVEPIGSLNPILAVLRARSGYNFHCYKKSTLRRRIERRMGLGQFETYAEYVENLRASPSELNELFHDLLICVTGFFRDADAWEVLARDVIPPIVNSHSDDDTIRVWVPGCGTGEEAYSLAMLFLEELREQQKVCVLQVFASDINDGALEIARSGLYPKNISADVPKPFLDRFFTEIKGDHHYTVNRVVREAVVFAHQNLIGDPPFSKLDLVSCRNLLIYLENEIQQRSISLFHFALRAGGYLFLGSAETLGRHTDLFTPVSKKWKIYSRNNTMRREVLQFPLGQSGVRGDLIALEPRSSESSETDVARLMQQIVLDQYSPAAVLIDRRFDIVYFSGPTHDYIVQPSGAPTNDLLRMAREGLRSKLRSLAARALREGKQQSGSGIRIKRGTTYQSTTVIVAPVRLAPDSDMHLLVVFRDELHQAESTGHDGSTGVGDEHLVRQLEHELQVTREDLHTHIEELETSNEELKSSNEEAMSINEELQSAAEELETSKEELQSLNEELSTVNYQLQEKVVQLETINNDLGNLLTSSEIATIFLDRQLRIKGFTPAVRKLLNIIPSDVGRIITDFSRNFVDVDEDVDLLTDAREVLSTLTPLEHEVSTDNGRWYQRRIMPYRTADDHIDGVVITFIETTERRVARARLEQSESRYRMLVDSTTDYAIFMLDPDGKFATWNTGAERILGYTEREVIGWSASIIFAPEDRALGEDLRELSLALEHGRAMGERWHLRKDGTRFWASGVVTPVYGTDGQLLGFSKVMRDQTERRRMNAELVQLNESLESMVSDRTSELRALSSELLMSEERERRMIASDLHDSIGQTLALATMKLKDLERGNERGDSVSEAAQLLDLANDAVRSLTMQISPPILYQIGLASALEWLAEEIEKRYGLAVALDIGVLRDDIDDRVRFILFRSARELLINVAKHAGVRDARVRVGSTDEQIALEVEDSGTGFDVTGEAISRRQQGFGLFSIRERLSYIGGEAIIQSTPGLGTTVILKVPVAIKKQPEQVSP